MVDQVVAVVVLAATAMVFLAFIFISNRPSENDDERPGRPSAQPGAEIIEEILRKKRIFLDKKINREIANVRKHGTRNKHLALQALKRKKFYEGQLELVDSKLSKIGLQREPLEIKNLLDEDIDRLAFEDPVAAAMLVASNGFVEDEELLAELNDFLICQEE